MAATHFDFANYLADCKAIMKDVLQYDGLGASATAFGYWRRTVTKIKGYYWDLYGGGGNLSSFQAAPSIDPNGNSGDWEANKAELALYQRTQMRVLDAAFYQSTENAEENLIGSGFDMMHVGGIGDLDVTLWGVNAQLFTVVYSRYQCLMNLAVTLNETTFDGDTQQGFYTAWINATFHATGGHFCISNGNETGGVLCPTDPPQLGQPNFRICAFIATAMLKVDTTPAIRTYMQRGWRMRPLPASWEGHAISLNLSAAGYAQEGRADGPTPHSVFSSVWMNPAADADFPSTSNCIGIVISSCGLASLTYNIYMDSEAYDLVPHRTKVLYLRVGAARTEITRFTETLDYDATITFDGATAPMYLFEVVQL